MRWLKGLSAGAAMLWAGIAGAGEVNTTFLGNLAIDGYDPVSYHTVGHPIEGDGDFTFKWREATWRFATKENRDLFAANPEAYAPSYGGHCANGMSQGHKVGANPELYRVIDGKLYLFFAPRGRERWSSGTDQWIKDADGNWVHLKTQ